MNKKLPEISVNEWLEAEREHQKKCFDPQPKGSMTVFQYAQTFDYSESHASTKLGQMIRSGTARREQWNSGKNGRQYVYWPVKKKK